MVRDEVKRALAVLAAGFTMPLIEKYGIAKIAEKDNRNIARGTIASVGDIAGVAKALRPGLGVPEYVSLGLLTMGSYETGNVLAGEEGVLVEETAAASRLSGGIQNVVQNLRSQINALQNENAQLKGSIEAMRSSEKVPVARYSRTRPTGYMRETEMPPVFMTGTGEKLSSKEMERVMGME